jgi:benzoyl-CoA 2,3-dioxygenase component B
MVFPFNARTWNVPDKGQVAAVGDFIASLMQAVAEPGEFASWISPPKVGIDNRPGDFEYAMIAA